MKYDEALAFIHGTRWLGSKLGLSRVSMLLERMGNPQDSLKFIHVAGTNGKGSTCAMISNILIAAGYKTGLYISPFVLDFRERMQINGEMILESELVRSVLAVKPHWEALEAMGETPTEFEAVTAVAMDYFSRMKCDIVVLEVGMGGRLDSTNVIKTPICSVITSIGMEHSEYLGSTLTEIAKEKCGIIKRNGIAVAYPDQTKEVMDVIVKTCGEQENMLITPERPEIISAGIKGSRFIYDGIEIFVKLAGLHQSSNAVTAIEAAKAAAKRGFKINAVNIADGISNTSFPARFEILSEDPLVILDGAHNPSGAERLAESMRLLEGRKIHAVFCAMKDKDIDSMLKAVLPLCESVTLASSTNPRAEDVLSIVPIAKKYCGNVYIAGNAEAAVIQPLAHIGGKGGGDALLIFGSLYYASEIRPVANAILERFD